jgi:predicted ATP-dependent endonuclease of OLD family
LRLHKIKIENFRSIEYADIEIDCLSVFIGENNAGKSNILRAVELFYEDTLRDINEEYFHFKDQSKPISIILTFNRLSEFDKNQKYLKHWIYEDAIRVKKVIVFDVKTQKYEKKHYGWQSKPKEVCFDLSKFDEYKSDINKIVEEKRLPECFRTEKGTVTQTSYKEGVAKLIEVGEIEFGEPGWIENPAGLKEVFTDLLPKFYLVPAVKDAQDESKVTQQTVLGKLIRDLTQRIAINNPQFDTVKNQLEGLKKFLNTSETGDNSERLQEIKDFERTITEIICECMPETKVGIEIITPELVDLFKDVRITLDDTLSTSIDSKGHGLQRALILSYIRAYAKTINTLQMEGEQGEIPIRNFILAIEEPELYLHPNGQRKIMKVLRDMAKTDQILACTHSSFFIDMFNYKNIVIVKRSRNESTKVFQHNGEIFSTGDQQEKERLKKVFRYLSFFDASRSEMFFSKQVIFVEGDTEKIMIPFWSSKFSEIDDKYDLVTRNISVIECGGKTNLHIFMRIANGFKIPYIVIHDVDPIDFPENKPNKDDKEKHKLRMFKENEFIQGTLEENIGKIIKINPDFEKIMAISSSQSEKYGKVEAAFLKYDVLQIDEYPNQITKILNLIIDWNDVDSVIQVG